MTNLLSSGISEDNEDKHSDISNIIIIKNQHYLITFNCIFSIWNFFII